MSAKIKNPKRSSEAHQQRVRYWMVRACKRAKFMAGNQGPGGGQRELAEALGVTKQMISWAKLYGKISGELCVKIHHWSDGEIPAHRMRPDLWDCQEHVPKKRILPPPIKHPTVVRGAA